MTHLYPSDPRVDVTVCLHGIPVVSEVRAVRGTLRLGEHPDARISFPGADLLLVSDGGRVRLRGRTLRPEEPLEIHLGAVQLRLLASEDRPISRAPTWTPDLRVLVATMAIVLVAAAWDTAGRAISGHQGLQAAVPQLAPALHQQAARAEVRSPQPSRYLEVPSPLPEVVVPDYSRPPVQFELLPAAGSPESN